VNADWIYFANESRDARGSTLRRAKERGLLPLAAFAAGEITTPLPHVTSLRPDQTILLAVSTRRGWRPLAVVRVRAPEAPLTHPRVRGRDWTFPALARVDDEDVPVDPLLQARTAVRVSVEQELTTDTLIAGRSRHQIEPYQKPSGR
jgi:hypothetical protein